MQTALVVLLLLAFGGCLWVIVFTSLRMDREKSIYFMIATLALSFYVLGYMGEVLATTAEAAFTALKIENAGIPIITPLYLLLMISLFHPSLMRAWMLPVSLAYGLVMLAVVITTNVHHLYYTAITMVPRGDGTYFAHLSHGPLYIVQQVVSLSCFLASYLIVFRRYHDGTRRLRSQMHLMIGGSAIPFVANILNFTGTFPGGVDPTPLVMVVSMVLFLVSLRKHRLMDLVPIASLNAAWSMEDALVVLDVQMALQYWNLAAAKLFPQLDNGIGGEPIHTLSSWPAELRNQHVPGEVTFCLTDAQGAHRYFRAKISQVADKRQRMMGWSYVMRDITENVTMMQQLEELATTDPLTGIHNRRQFMNMVNHEMEVAVRLQLNTALIMYDLDHFKDVNDTFGHQAGDYVLCAIANIIKNQLRPYDIFARYGGEEFVIFTTSNEQFDLFAFAERLRERIAKAEISYDGNRIPITASFGVVSLPAKAKFEDAMRAVDVALYKAKYSGRNQVVIADEI